MKKLLKTLLFCSVLILSLSHVIYASPSLNERAKRAYENYVQKAKDSGRGYFIAYKDLDGDGIVELALEYHPYRNGSTYVLQIYTYKQKKVYRMLNYYQYGADSLTAYKKGLVCHGRGHGSDWYVWFKKVGYKYRIIAQKSRKYLSTIGKWYYGNQKDYISKNQYKRLVRTIKKKKINTIGKRGWKFVWEAW